MLGTTCRGWHWWWCSTLVQAGHICIEASEYVRPGFNTRCPGGSAVIDGLLRITKGASSHPGLEKRVSEISTRLIFGVFGFVTYGSSQGDDSQEDRETHLVKLFWWLWLWL